VTNSSKKTTIPVLGYGSLLSEDSARQTVGSLANFRLVLVPGFKRIFNKVGIFFFARYSASENDIRISSCATRKYARFDIICSQFECSEEDFLSMYEREHRFQWVSAEFHAPGGVVTRARMCTENTDENYLLNKCVTQSEYWNRVGRYYSGKIWRDDILPFPTYLKHCLNAAQSQGDDVYDNFLDSSFLADGRTSIRKYIDETPDWAVGAEARYAHDGDG